jgi:hypothetical protein
MYPPAVGCTLTAPLFVCRELEVSSWGRCGLWGVNSSALTFFVSWGTAAPAAEALFSPALEQEGEVEVEEGETGIESSRRRASMSPL